MDTKILITGVAGLIGSHLSRYFLDKGYKVYGIDNLSGGYIENLDDRLVFYNTDLNDTFTLNQIFTELKPTHVYHLAAYAAEGLSPFIRNYNYTSNLICSANVINACINNDVKKVIFTSSMAVYGDNKVPFVETMTPSPKDPYGIAKYAVEMDLSIAKEQFGLDYTILRPHNVVGIYQNIWDKYRNVIGIWIYNILNNKNIIIFGDGLQKRAFSDIKFCLPAFEKLLIQGGGQTYNIGSDKEYTILETANIMKEIAAKFGYTPTIEFLKERHEVKNAYSDHTKIKNELEFTDNTDLKETIREMFKWAKEQSAKKIRTMDYEITKQMYEYW